MIELPADDPVLRALQFGNVEFSTLFKFTFAGGDELLATDFHGNITSGCDEYLATNGITGIELPPVGAGGRRNSLKISFAGNIPGSDTETWIDKFQEGKADMEIFLIFLGTDGAWSMPFLVYKGASGGFNISDFEIGVEFNSPFGKTNIGSRLRTATDASQKSVDSDDDFLQYIHRPQRSLVWGAVNRR